MFHTVMLVIPVQPVDLSPGELLYYSVVQFYKTKTNANGVSGFFCSCPQQQRVAAFVLVHKNKLETTKRTMQIVEFSSV